jgi:hypothetical protein
MTMALHAFDRNVARYGNKLDPGTIAELTARQANAAFGELNYKLMARNPSVQDFLRLTLLAPDFLEARTRFIGQALKPYGAEQRAALMLMGASLYVTARALNKWLDDDPHWTKPFSVFYNGREYKLRTVLGDVSELATDPRRFLYNRFSPWLKIGATVGTGRDYRGIKLTGWEQVKDALSWLVPIPLGGQEGANTTQRILGSSGVSNKPAPSAVNNMYKLAADFRDAQAKTDPKLRAEARRAFQETYAQSDYAKLNQFMTSNDNERAVTEIARLLKEEGKDPTTIVKYYTNLPAKPFTGSTLLEFQFVSQLPAEQKAAYARANQERLQLSDHFMQLLPLALKAAGK